MTETATLTLTAFLLARIAEDEERAQFVARQIGAQKPFEPWLLSWHDEYDLLCIEPSRALAECEAKRKIVEWAETSSGEWYWESVLNPLAAVYADHPDYDENWRP
jgi:hypothetical protein